MIYFLLMQFGNEIDGHDVVMRFNDAPTRGFEEHAGRRCTFRAVSGEHARMLLGLAKFDRGDRGAFASCVGHYSAALRPARALFSFACFPFQALRRVLQ